MNRQFKRRASIPERAFLVLNRIRTRRKRTLTHRRLAARSQRDVSEVDVTMMERAIKLAAEAANRNEVPVAAVIYSGTEIIAEASNNREATNDPTGHAEMVALREAGLKLDTWRLKECSMAVTLEPCPMCAGALVNARLGRLIYGAFDPKAGACHTLYTIPSDARLNHRVEMIGGVLESRCAELLSAFFKSRREQKR